jgi:hypothetical protein
MRWTFRDHMNFRCMETVKVWQARREFLTRSDRKVATTRKAGAFANIQIFGGLAT